MNIRILLGDIVGYFLLLYWKIFEKRKFNFKMQLLSVYFHNPQKKVFEHAVNFLHHNGYRFISTEELYLIINSKTKLNTKTALITLDDAWIGNLTNVIPFIEQHRIPITIFTATNPLKDGVLWLNYFRDKTLLHQYETIFPELKLSNPKKLSTACRNEIWKTLRGKKKYTREIMTEENIQGLSKSKYITIGSHTVSHPILPNCEEKELRYELSESKQKLQEMLHSVVNSLAYPNGDYNDDVIEECKRAGYIMAFTTEQRLLDIEKDSLYKLPRYSVPNEFGKYESIARALGLWNKFLSL
ncbi:polysaccharide deacetylase family protein [Limibacterium fermenti]|uniref:polysaccharide deacetylase family protein n=1 Tax=Limibacterium fermenti TaxID=3229863 RepID=UPI003A724731